MTKLDSILFNRAIKQFLECEDIDSKKGRQSIEKIKQFAGAFLEKILLTITLAPETHKVILRSICCEGKEAYSETILLDSLAHESSPVRQVAADILSKSKSLSPEKLLGRMRKGEASNVEIMGLLGLQSKKLKPEVIINCAVGLDDIDGIQLLTLVEQSEVPIELEKFRFQSKKIKDPSFKAALVRYLGNVTQLSVVELITRFLLDANRMVVLAALSALNNLNFRYDASIILPFISDLNKVEQKLALEVIDKHADATIVPRLLPYLNLKSESVKELLYNIIANHATRDSFEKFLTQLEKQGSWNREQVVSQLQSLENPNLIEVTRALSAHDDEFVRSSCQKISAYQLDANDLEKIGEFALNENWQVRQRAILTLGKSGNRVAISILKEVLKQWPDTAMSVLEAVKLLGISKGLEIAFKCLGNAEASIQRSALETIAAITSEKHAQKTADNIISCLPRINQALQDPANRVINELQSRFGISTAALDGDLVKRSNVVKKAIANSHMPNLKPGSVWMDRYEIRKEIGQGSMGHVVLVEDEMIEELVILKFMHPELTIDMASRERFKREVKYARRVGHANVIRVHDLVMKDNVCAISMEYFKSCGLERLLGDSKCFGTRDGLNILYQVSDGMAAAHGQAVVHRDLKPSNILIDDTCHVKIADFGIASAGSGAESTLTQTGSIIGSPAYLAPERAEEMEADNRCDIYSLGVIAYYMFAGQLPYVGRPMEIILQHRDGKAAMVHEVNQEANLGVSKLIKQMMAVEPRQRIQTMDEVRHEVKRLLDAT